MRNSRVLTAATGLLLLAGLAIPAPASAADDRSTGCIAADSVSGTNVKVANFSWNELTAFRYETFKLDFTRAAGSTADTVKLLIGHGDNIYDVTTAPISAGTLSYTFPARDAFYSISVVASRGTTSNASTTINFDLKCGRICDSGAPAGFNAITGTNGADVLTGTSGRDFIVGLGGNDSISANGGDDIVCAGAGNDTAGGGFGNDLLFGDDGADTQNGGNGTDTGIDPNGKTQRVSIERTAM